MSEGCVGVGSGVGFRVVGLSLLCTLVVLSGRVVGARVGGPAFNPLPAPEFLLEAPGRSSDPSEAVEVAPGVPGRSPWCPGTVGGRLR